MSKRLQVLLSEQRFDELKRVARAQGVTVAAWVRAVLENACREAPLGSAERKLAAIREAVAHDLPTADIEQMREEIGAGRAEGWDA